MVLHRQCHVSAALAAIELSPAFQGRDAMRNRFSRVATVEYPLLNRRYATESVLCHLPSLKRLG
jgi:hypothetical protein